ESRGGIADQQLIEIERPIEIVVRRRRETARGGSVDQRHGLACTGLEIEKAVDITSSQRAFAQPPRQAGERQRQAHDGRGSPRGRPPTPFRLGSLVAMYFTPWVFVTKTHGAN